MGNGYHVIAGLNLFTLVCAVGLFLLMLLVSNDRKGGLLAVYLGVPFCLGHVVIAGFPAWVYLAGAERCDANRRALKKLLIRSLLPIAIVTAGLIIVVIVPKTK